MEGIDYWSFMDIDKMLSNDDKPCIDTIWIRDRLEKEDRVFVRCLIDKYYYTAKVKKIEKVGERRKFLITFEDMSASHDNIYDYAQACDSFLPVNLQTADFVLAYNDKRLQSIEGEISEDDEDDEPFEKDCDPKGRAFLLKFNNLDRDLIAKKFQIKYPPRLCIAEFLGTFVKQRTSFVSIQPYSVDDFLADFESKISENDFKNELFHGDAESQDASEYCTKIKNDLSLETVNLAYHFGVLHLLRYISHLFQILDIDENMDEKKKKQFFLVHELAQFISCNNNTYYGVKDYVRD